VIRLIHSKYKTPGADVQVIYEGDRYHANLTSDFIFTKKNLYQSLNKLAKKILCVPAISAPVARVFCQSGLLMRSHRSSFAQTDICILTSLKCNQILL